MIDLARGIRGLAGLLMLRLRRGSPGRLPALERAIRNRFPDVREIEVRELEAMLSRDPGEQPILLDARTPEEFAVSHLPGAVLADSVERARALLAEAPSERDVVVYCSVGYRSALLARELAGDGHRRVSNLRGSIFAWANAGLPVHRAGRPVSDVHPYDARWGRFLRPELRAKSP
jgi:rhodanese-related sulfurtransferase